jgi:hypothetical protein
MVYICSRITPQLEEALKKKFFDAGWKLFENTDEILSFHLYEDEDHEWFRDYYKKENYFINYNGRQKINLVTSHEPRQSDSEREGTSESEDASKLSLQK